MGSSSAVIGCNCGSLLRCLDNSLGAGTMQRLLILQRVDAQVGNSWRTTQDISPNWDALLRCLDNTVGLARFAGPGAWNDPDMLEVSGCKTEHCPPSSQPVPLDAACTPQAGGRRSLLSCRNGTLTVQMCWARMRKSSQSFQRFHGPISMRFTERSVSHLRCCRQVGNGKMSPAEDRAHFALWALLKAPLLIGTDLRTAPQSVRDVLLADEVIAVRILCVQMSGCGSAGALFIQIAGTAPVAAASTAAGRDWSSHPGGPVVTPGGCCLGLSPSPPHELWLPMLRPPKMCLVRCRSARTSSGLLATLFGRRDPTR